MVPRLYLVLATAVTLSMAVVVLGAGLRWSLLDRGSRLIVAAIGVFLSLSVVAAPLSQAGVRTRLLQEVPILVGTVLDLVGFSLLQPDRPKRRILLIGVALFGLAWVVAQLVQGSSAEFSELSGPFHAATICAAAGYTMVNRVLVTRDRWTSHLWFWLCIGLLLVYGADVLLDPLMANTFKVRNDLVFIALYFHLIGSVAGYTLIAWGVWRVGYTVKGAAPTRTGEYAVG